MNKQELEKEIKLIFLNSHSHDIYIENNNASIELRFWSEEIFWSLNKIQKLINLFQLKTDHDGLLINEDDLILKFEVQEYDYEGTFIVNKITIKHNFLFEKEEWEKYL